MAVSDWAMNNLGSMGMGQPAPAPVAPVAPAPAPAAPPRYDPFQDPMMNLGADQIQKILAQQPKQAALDRQQAQAEALRSGPMPKGRMVSGHYIKPSDLDMVAGGVNSVLGNIQGKISSGQQGSLDQQGSQNQMALINALRGNVGSGSAGAAAAGGGMAELPFGIGDLI